MGGGVLPHGLQANFKESCLSKVTRAANTMSWTTELLPLDVPPKAHMLMSVAFGEVTGSWELDTWQWISPLMSLSFNVVLGGRAWLEEVGRWGCGLEGSASLSVPLIPLCFPHHPMSSFSSACLPALKTADYGLKLLQTVSLNKPFLLWLVSIRYCVQKIESN